MTPEPLNEREFELINIIGKPLGSNQRDLSQHLNLSLGQTNMLIRRLVAKGYIRITQLNKKKVQYLLTPQGIAEKMRKSVKYTLNTINSIGLIRSRISALLKNCHQQGYRQFDVLGHSDLVVLVEMVFKELNLPDSQLQCISDAAQHQNGRLLLVATENFSAKDDGSAYVNLIEELSKEMGES